MNDKEMKKKKYDYSHNFETLHMQKPNIQEYSP